jgi:EAL and modified HD-GYP domain-containing signal transduction protein
MSQSVIPPGIQSGSQPGQRLGLPATRSAAGREVFVSRQPIFAAGLQLHGYRLLFRSSDLDSFFASTDPTRASGRVITDSFLTIGIDAIADGHKVFLGFTRDLLLGGFAQLLPDESTVVELAAEVGADASVLRACRELRDAGYELAVPAGIGARLEALADYRTVDLRRLVAADRQALADDARRGVCLLAENVESREDLADAVALGCSFYQGFFFAEPVVVSGRDVPASRHSYLRILAEIHRPQLDFATLEGVVKQDLSLSYKFLAYLNAAHFGWRRQITSIRDALVLLGEDGARRWVSLVTLSVMVHDKPQELLLASAVRARFAEALGAAVDLADRQLELFTMGMFSMLDAILDQPLAEALARVPLSDDVKTALTGGGGPLAEVLAVVLAYERGRWDAVSAAASRLGCPESRLLDFYVDAVEWARDTFGEGGIG